MGPGAYTIQSHSEDDAAMDINSRLARHREFLSSVVASGHNSTPLASRIEQHRGSPASESHPGKLQDALETAMERSSGASPAHASDAWDEAEAKDAFQERASQLRRRLQGLSPTSSDR